jgi:hypothetical protein
MQIGCDDSQLYATSASLRSAGDISACDPEQSRKQP